MTAVEGLRDALERFRGDATLARRLEEALAPLREYDRRHGSELVNTLVTYVARESIVATADALFLHRNSVVYRLQRIEEITGLPLRQLEVRRMLLVALTLAQGALVLPQEHDGGCSHAGQRQE